MAHAASETPDRLNIGNLATGDSIEVQYNPTELDEAYAAAYARQTVPGLSHKVLQFTNTENMTLSFELSFDMLSRTKDYKYADADYARKFLIALHYPRSGGLMRDVAPARALFVWPSMFTIEVVSMSVKFKHTRFARTGQSTAFVASVALEEIRDVRLNADDIMRHGTFR